MTENNMWMPSILQDLLGKEVIVDTEEKIETTPGHKQKKPEFQDGLNFYVGFLKNFDNEFVLLENSDCPQKELIAVKRSIITTIREYKDHSDGGGGGSTDQGGGIPQQAKQGEVFICDNCKKEMTQTPPKPAVAEPIRSPYA